MAEYDELLKKGTFKGQFESLKERVFATLDKRENEPNGDLQSWRNSKLLAELFVVLQASERWDDDAIDKLLLNSIGPQAEKPQGT